MTKYCTTEMEEEFRRYKRVRERIKEFAKRSVNFDDIIGLHGLEKWYRKYGVDWYADKIAESIEDMRERSKEVHFKDYDKRVGRYVWNITGWVTEKFYDIKLGRVFERRIYAIKGRFAKTPFIPTYRE